MPWMRQRNVNQSEQLFIVPTPVGSSLVVVDTSNMRCCQAKENVLCCLFVLQNSWRNVPAGQVGFWPQWWVQKHIIELCEAKENVFQWGLDLHGATGMVDHTALSLNEGMLASSKTLSIERPSRFLASLLFGGTCFGEEVLDHCC